jgi:peptidoglycan/xylan/chitin deacetylase (PgdA/CDA1 family)
MKMPQHGRYPHSPITQRPAYEWPNGSRLALTVCNNIEHFAYRTGLGSDSTGISGVQNQRGYAWRDYGNRVGLWSLFDVLDDLDIPAAHNINSEALEACPEIGQAMVNRGDEFVGHGRTNSERQDVLWEEDERRLIAESRDVLARHAGKPPTGWMGPWIAESAVTLDLLKEEGFTYVMDWPADDQPFWMTTRAGPILSVPYSIEINDSPAMIARHHTGRQFAEFITDHFDMMLEQSAKRPMVCSIVLHPFIIGQPSRLKPFREAIARILDQRDKLWLTRPNEIAAHVAGLPKGIIPGSEFCND